MPRGATRLTVGVPPAPVLRLHGLAPAEAADWRRRLKETAHPCGCKSGAALALVALIAWPLRFILVGPPLTPLGLGLAIVGYAFVVVAAGLVGKVAGIVVGRWRHRRLRERLARRLVLARPTAGR